MGEALYSVSLDVGTGWISDEGVFIRPAYPAAIRGRLEWYRGNGGLPNIEAAEEPLSYEQMAAAGYLMARGAEEAWQQYVKFVEGDGRKRLVETCVEEDRCGNRD